MFSKSIQDLYFKPNVYSNSSCLYSIIQPLNQQNQLIDLKQNHIPMMLIMKENVFPHRRQSKFKTALGNTIPRYNSEVHNERKKYITSSTKNSQDTPEWMSRTNKFSLRSNSLHSRNHSVHNNPEGPFMQTKQKWIYESNPKSQNISGQFQTIRTKRPRSKWQMKGHTFDFEWSNKVSTVPLKQTSQIHQTRSRDFGQSRSKVAQFFKIQLPKYGLKQSPLYQQRQTPIKIGHPTLIDSVYVK